MCCNIYKIIYQGRLILPQVQIISYILDNDGMALTVKNTELSKILESLKREPSLVITDSKMFKKSKCENT